MNFTNFLLHISGMDATGKTTLCNEISKIINANITHFSNPNDLDDGKKQYFDFLNNMSTNKNYICDRFHDGEWVYAPIYRNYIANYLKEIETKIVNKHNYMLALTTAELDTIIERIKKRGEDFVQPKHYQTVINNFTNNYLMEQHMPFTIVDTTNKNKQECINQVTEDMLKLNTIWNTYRGCITYNQHNCNVTFPIALPRGNMRAKYMIVGQNPAGRGKSNHKYITMFNDNSGSGMIMNILKKAGIYLDCWFTNIVQCSTTDNKITNNQVKECKLILSLEIKHIKPEKIFALGNEAYKYMKKYFSELNIIKVKHPAYVKRFYSKKPNKINEYINKFKGEKC